MNTLERIVAATREEVARRREAVPEPDYAREARKRTNFRPFAGALSKPGLSVIAEHKRRSPSAGVIRDDLDLEDVVQAYERGGAAALSILTEGPNFGGSLADLREARLASGLPILRKDFIVERYQLYEALHVGADAILLIVAALSDEELAELQALAGELNLAALVEVHDERELDRALASGARLIGINNRDLTTLRVDVQTTYRLLPQIPEGTVVVAESGLRSREQLDELGAQGVNAVLIGEALMRSSDIEAALRALAPTM